MAAKRKAWNKSMAQVAEQAGTKLKLKGAKPDTKRETRRRVNARRWIATSGIDDLQRKVESRLESFEEAEYEGDLVDQDDDEWVDEEAGESRGRKAKAKASKKIKASGSLTKSSSKDNLGKRYRPRPLSQVLLEEQALVGSRSQEAVLIDYVRAEAGPSKRPSRKLCPVTGLPSYYRDPESNLPFATLAARSQLKDTPPPWLQLTGNAPYMETIRTIKREHEERLQAQGRGSPAPRPPSRQRPTSTSPSAFLGQGGEPDDLTR